MILITFNSYKTVNRNIIIFFLFLNLHYQESKIILLIKHYILHILSSGLKDHCIKS